MKKYFITTLGCKVNQFESESMAKSLSESGWEDSDKEKNADICIINTCTVTSKASMQSRNTIRQAIKNNPDAKIVVTGCYAQTEPEEIKKISGVDKIIGHDKKHEITSALIEKPELFNELSNKCNKCTETKFKKMDAVSTGNRTRPYLKIQDGCDSFCTYCMFNLCH